MRLTFLTILGFLWIFAGPVKAQDVLGGVYHGVQDGEGARIEIAPDGDGFRGTFFDAQGNSQPFEASRNGPLAETELSLSSGPVFMRIDPRPYGADVALIPIDREDKIVLEDTLFLTFLREGLSLPEPPANYIAPPDTTAERITGRGFLASYEFWPPEGVRRGYLALPPRFVTLMRLFPAVQLDVIFKLCLSGVDGPAVATALRGQGVNCREVVDGMAAIQRDGRWESYKRQVAGERDTLSLNVRCADGYLTTKSECERAAVAISKQAAAGGTAAIVLRDYR